MVPAATQTPAVAVLVVSGANTHPCHQVSSSRKRHTIGRFLNRWREIAEEWVRKTLRRARPQTKGPPAFARGLRFTPGGDLLSHTVSRAVPSALEGLTSLFGMGRGVTPPP